MRPAPLPPDEEERLQALYDLNLLDTEEDPAYQAIVALASSICEVPIASITLVDRDRQWHKACTVPVEQSPRDVAFCAHTILQDEPLTVPDALEDERFHDNPLVTDGPKIRFYTGSRLLTPSGHAVGTLCVIDQKPRVLTEAQRTALKQLAVQASALLLLRAQTRKLERALEAADEASRAKSDFLSRMSHELRTPLNAIIGFSRALNKSVGSTLKGRDGQFLGRIETNGVHLLRLINDILDLSKVEAGKTEMVLEPTDVRVLVGDVIAALHPADGVTLEADIPSNLRPLVTDALRLKQMILNLVGNALKFTKAGSVTICVRANAWGEVTAIEVTDTGLGIPESRLAAVFDAFEQATPQTATNFGGTGLGLAITRSFADLLGYGISVQSMVGVGSTFTLIISDQVNA